MGIKFNLVSQTPHSSAEGFGKTISDLSYLSEKFNYESILVTHSTSGIDPWVITFEILQHTQKVTPLIAIQPDYISTLTLVRLIKGINDFHSRTIHLNLIHGTSKRLSEETRNVAESSGYTGLESYITEIHDKLSSSERVNNDFGSFGNKGVKAENKEYHSNIYLSGSGEAALKSASRMKCGFLTIPEPIELFEELVGLQDASSVDDIGICLGIITRPTAEEAWEVAKREFSYTRENMISLRFKKDSKMNSVRRMADLAVKNDTYDDVYWLGAFISGKNIYPYLVGSYDQVAEYLKRYYSLGVRTIILNVPFSIEEFDHRSKMFSMLLEN